jgi:RNA polymerase sigma factor (sigma-70 family)
MNTQNLPTLTDQQLLQLYVNGNIEALSSLITRHKRKIYTSIYLLVKNRHAAEDIFQDVFIKVIESLKEGKYADEGKFLPWVIRIAHNMCIDFFRREKRKPIVKNTDDNNDIFEALDFVSSQADKNIISKQTVEGVRAIVDQLPPDQREVIILRHYAELSFKEIAVLTHCSINTVLGRMRYALINLRKMTEEREVAL